MCAALAELSKPKNDSESGPKMATKTCTNGSKGLHFVTPTQKVEMQVRRKRMTGKTTRRRRTGGHTPKSPGSSCDSLGLLCSMVTRIHHCSSWQRADTFSSRNGHESHLRHRIAPVPGWVKVLREQKNAAKDGDYVLAAFLVGKE